MAYLDWLGQTLQAKLADKPIGEPVALRAYLQLTSDHGLLTPTLAAALAMAGRWFGSAKPTVYAQGGPELGYVGALATFPGGQTALIAAEMIRSSAETRGEFPSATVLLIGNHGTMQFTDSPGSDDWAFEPAPPRGADQQRILALIQESLRGGKPVS